MKKHIFHRTPQLWYAAELGSPYTGNNLQFGLGIYKVELPRSKVDYYKMILVDYIEEKVEEILP